jgi:hypothetical protein
MIRTCQEKKHFLSKLRRPRRSLLLRRQALIGQPIGGLAHIHRTPRRTFPKLIAAALTGVAHQIHRDLHQPGLQRRCRRQSNRIG